MLIKISFILIAYSAEKDNICIIRSKNDELKSLYMCLKIESKYIIAWLNQMIYL